MSLSFTHLPSHMTTDEAWTVITFLDLMREALWETYGEEITAMLKEASQPHHDSWESTLNLDDDEPF